MYCRVEKEVPWKQDGASNFVDSCIKVKSLHLKMSDNLSKRNTLNKGNVWFERDFWFNII